MTLNSFILLKCSLSLVTMIEIPLLRAIPAVKQSQSSIACPFLSKSVLISADFISELSSKGKTFMFSKTLH